VHPNQLAASSKRNCRRAEKRLWAFHGSGQATTGCRSLSLASYDALQHGGAVALNWELLALWPAGWPFLEILHCSG